MITNPLAQIVIVAFICATIGSKFTKNDGPFQCAGIVSVIFGFGYLMYKLH